MTVTRYIPVWLRHVSTPGIHGFAALQGFEAITRGLLISVLPLEMYRATEDAGLVSSLYFGIGLLSLFTGLMVPFATRFVPRRWLYTLGAMLFLMGTLAAVLGGQDGVVLTVLCNSLGTVICFVCLNAYVLDYIAREDLSRCESTRMFYAALGWTAGPLTGVLLLDWWRPAPFLLAGLSAAVMLTRYARMKSCTVRSSMPTWRILVPGMNPSLSSIHARRAASVQTMPEFPSASE
jgi:hypothetical protein